MSNITKISENNKTIVDSTKLAEITNVSSSTVSPTGVRILDDRVIVKQVSDFGIIDSTKEYFLDGIIDMGATSLEIPSGGIFISGYNFNLSGLISTENNYTLFTSPVGGSGDVLFMDFHIDVSGTTSQVYDIVSDTGFNAIEIDRINFNNCTSSGTIDSYRQGLETGTGRFGGTPELTLSGTWVGGYFIDTSIVRSLDDGNYTLYKAGAGFSMASRFRSNQNIDLPANVSFVDFAPANFVNPSTLQLEGCLISRDGAFNAADSNLTPNIAASDLVSIWTGNNGLPNTFIGGEKTVSNETPTTILVQGDFYDVEGTWTATELQHFDAPINGELRHLGSSPLEFKVTGTFIISSTTNDTVSVKTVIFRAATTTFDFGKTISRPIDRLQGLRHVAYFPLSDRITLNKDDYVKFQISNDDSTDDVTVEDESFFIVETR